MTVELARKKQFKNRFNKNYSSLCNVAYRFISDRDECEDIVQETFVAVWNNGKDSLPEKEFVAYMAGAVRNNCISFLRKRRLDTVSIDEVTSSSVVISIDDTDDERERVIEDVLEKALSILPPKCREVFLMSKLKGMKYREIAEATGTSEKTVENHMGKAMKTLREYVTNHPFFILSITLISILITTIKR
ncbi:RNA polymerase sigma-70 factor [Bacteroides sp.]|uniref:RNA polymerase sigma factor n=1 Tax=Bacteroides sp. TaxID=29523 RepID=UPI002FC67F7F